MGGRWRFFLRSLVVGIASAVQPVNFRTNVPSANDAAVTSTNWSQIVSDLDPSANVSFTSRCDGVSYTDNVSGYSRRRQFWNRDFVVAHEAFHRQDWIAYYRRELARSEREVWAYSLPASTAPNAAAAAGTARPALAALVGAAYGRACAAYTPQKESRAYGAGLFDYLGLVMAVQQRARVEHWPGAPAPNLEDLGPGDFPVQPREEVPA